jgi:hypothetical protein
MTAPMFVEAGMRPIEDTYVRIRAELYEFLIRLPQIIDIVDGIDM